MVKMPFIANNLLSPDIFKLLIERLSFLKSSGNFTDDVIFHRKYFYNDPFFKFMHNKLLLSLANDLFEEKLKPSYCLLSSYDKVESYCPIHVDRPPCYRTINLCLDQKEIWPIFVNSKNEIREVCQFIPDMVLPFLEKQKMDMIYETSTAYELKPGQALCYAGTEQPHWRNKISPGNFCDLIFFHFVPENYEGSLD